MFKCRDHLAAAVVLVALSSPAYAYIDPGSGSMILQGILAAVAAIAVTAKLWWHRLLVLLKIRKPSSMSTRGSAVDGNPSSESHDGV